jgi:hypothetical protein
MSAGWASQTMACRFAWPKLAELCLQARDVTSLFSDSGENQFLVLEDFVESRLILFDNDLVGKNGLLIFHDGALVGEDGFLIFHDRGLVVQNCLLIG